MENETRALRELIEGNKIDTKRVGAECAWQWVHSHAPAILARIEAADRMEFIGIELEPKYFDIACRRIEEAYKQPDLFIPQPEKPIQDCMLKKSEQRLENLLFLEGLPNEN